ncbi:MAG: ATP-binding cassette domain-containing protein [Saprospiraceae bacterium]|nr:ATP-binding cassette domain-containing protein [Saprospiraceae bacterium]MBK6563955.1 ATP-binding cassette domain-containing protein [Saprospiraceae bacterium]MBK6783705.1 ATP-binding cassette domain-containing protein [Saprospiraceae bacterium]MBK7524616.1 ATP-binding cassette domain-containing protein [Saprospiraceae bacterium]MBK8373058.1 ATP-binding cassette domain-containing protein [Saprospiraceae bacterium]
MNHRFSDKKPVIVIQNLYKAFGNNKVLDGFNMELYDGETLVIMGKSGSGKSVMIKCLIGLETHDDGQITIMDKNLDTMDEATLNEIRTEVGFLFQGSALYDSMSVRENLEFPLRRHVKKFGEINDATPLVMEALDSVGLGHTIELMPEELSGGMKRRIALARTLILKPKIILYDEPTTGLDPITSKEIVILMKSIQEKYKTSSIVITHDVDCARFIADRMILLVDGINYAEGTFEELDNSSDPKVKAFFKS